MCFAILEAQAPSWAHSDGGHQKVNVPGGERLDSEAEKGKSSYLGRPAMRRLEERGRHY